MFGNYIREGEDYIIVLIRSKYLFIIASLFLLFILLYYIFLEYNNINDIDKFK